MIGHLLCVLLSYLTCLDNVAACIDRFLMVGVENVKEEGDAAHLDHVLHNCLALLADLADATVNGKKVCCNAVSC